MTPVRNAPSTALQWTQALGVVALALVVSASLRHRLIEPAQVAAFCGSAGGGEPMCILRRAVVAMFAEQRLGWAAMLLSLLALWTRRRALGLLAIAVASAGLMLYCTRYAAPAAVLAALALLPTCRPAGGAVGASPDEAGSVPGAFAGSDDDAGPSR